MFLLYLRILWWVWLAWWVVWVYCLFGNIGQKFLNLLDSCFPIGHELRQMINRNTVKISYSTMPNMGQQLK